MPPRKRKEDLSTLSYEKALGELKQIVTRLEAGTTSLEESIQLFERGQALAKHCGDLLSKAELKVKRLAVRREEGSIGEEDLASAAQEPSQDE